MAAGTIPRVALTSRIGTPKADFMQEFLDGSGWPQAWAGPSIIARLFFF
jgi:hypothetical protein